MPKILNTIVATTYMGKKYKEISGGSDNNEVVSKINYDTNIE